MLLRSHGCGPDGLWGVRCSGRGREQSTTKVHLGSHPHPQPRRCTSSGLGRTLPRSLLSNPKEDASGNAPWIPTVLAAGSAWAHNCPMERVWDLHSLLPRPHHWTPPEWVFLLQSCHPFGWKIIFLDRFLFGSLCSMSDFPGKDDRVSGLRDTVWLSTFSSRNLVVLIPGWLMRSGGGQAGRPFFLRNGAAATQPAVLTPRSRFLRHTYPISYPHPNKAH